VELAERIAQVRETIAAAAVRSGRSAGAVTLVAVSKTVEADRVVEAVALGLLDLGENRVQEAQEKIPAVAAVLAARGLPSARWHLIGHLQTNKSRSAVSLFTTIQSVDSERLGAALGRLGQAQGRPVPCLLEVNIGEEPSKFGFRPAELPDRLESLLAVPGLAVRGLMTVAPAVAEAEQARPYFQQLRSLRDQLAARYPNAELPELSMGMTGDYVVAIEEGATIVRVGRAIFGERA
jgi:pyridoxal phosphate enzyme (YggS family)